MKKIFHCFLAVAIVGSGIFFSCQKEISLEQKVTSNKPPIAIAGADWIITFPTDSILLDGSASSDPDGRIREWRWQKISGPASFIILNSTTSNAIAKNLSAGSYAFELKVTDDGGLSAIGTLLVTVDSISMTNHPPVPNAGADQIITLGAGNWFAWDFGGDYSSTINIYDATADSWSTSTLTEARGAMAAIAVGNKNYWAGGLNELGQTTYLPVSTGEIMDMSTGSVTHECLFQPNSGFTAVQKSSRILFSTTHSTQSGWLIPGIVTNKLDIYDPANDSWSIGVLPVNIYDASIISVNNTVYVAGGIVNGALSNQVWTLEF